MSVDAAATILADVTAAAELLGRAEASSTAIGDLDHLLQALQRIVADLGSQRVLQLSSTQLMNAGVELYNAPRAALKVLVQTEKSKEKEDEQPASFPRYLLALTRFVAAKIMGLSLVCSKGGSEENVKQNMHFVDEYVDVLRSFGRVGMLMLESASIDCEKCEQYLLLAKEAFASSLQLWSRIGLSHLTKTKQDLELEDVVDDLWDFCVDRVRVLQLLAKGSDMVEEFQDIVSTLHELKMLAPYKPSYGSILLDLMTSVSDGYAQTAQHELQVRFAEEVLHTSESLRNDADTNFLSIVTVFKQHILLNLLGSLCAIGDIERAETCFQHVPDNQDPKALLLIINLYVENKQFEKAHRLLLVLFQQDNLDDAILGARSYAKGLSYSERGMEIYRELVHNYGDASVTISLAIACDFALHEDQVYRLRAVEEIKRLGLLVLEKERNGQTSDTQHIKRIRQTAFDALQNALNLNQHEECLKWADAGLAFASTKQVEAAYMRTISRSCIQLERYEEANVWARKAFSVEPSKQSFFATFRVALHTDSMDNQEELLHMMEQLKARDDFELQDLFAMGKLVSDLGSTRQDILLHILDELCRAFVQTDDCLADVPTLLVLQNAAQLSFSNISQLPAGQDADPDNSFSDKFLEYTSALLQLSRPDILKDKHSVGSSSVFEWFFRMSFDIGKSTEDSRYFILAADVAERSNELYGEKSPLESQCHQCLLAAISADVKKIETLDKSRLLQLLQVVERYESIADDAVDGAAETKRYMAKTVIAAKLRLFDTNTTAILEICKTMLYKHVSELAEIGELVLYATKFNEASEVRDSYRSLARDIFSYGLQMLVQEASVDSSKLCYFLRRMTTLAASKVQAHECYNQLLQLIGSLDVTFSETELEWFVVSAWNLGVMCQRNNKIEEAIKCVKTAQSIMQHSVPLVEKLGEKLYEHYQTLLALTTTSNIIG